MALGKATYGGNKKQYFKLKEGTSTFRILPPMGTELNKLSTDTREIKIWSAYYRVHYGYANSANKSRPFESCLEKNSKGMVEVPDAAVERFNKLKAGYEEAKKTGNKKNEEALSKLVGTKDSRYNVDSNHYMNAIDLQGNIGILKLRHTAKKALDVLIKKLAEKNVDPLSEDNGRYFTFTRTGMGRETSFAVEVHTETMTIPDVGEVKRDVVHKLDETIIKRLKGEAADLEMLFKRPTASQVAQIVAESNLHTGVSPNIDEILGYKKEDTAADGDAVAEEAAEPEELSAAPAVTEAAQAQIAALPEEPKVSPIVETKAEAKVEPKKTAPAAAAPTTAQKVADMSDDEFMSSLGLSK